ncbi:MAG TPA: protoporphyrinogen oxidase [Pirellulaceae bacterium]|nr:protoporphyrinogen oxidase [Pirellulaceae bacterium]
MPDEPRDSAYSVAVIGGGISGLAAAHRLIELDPSVRVTLFEASDRLGGVLGTIRREGYLIERSADMFTTREPWALDLCRRIGFADQLIGTTPENRRAFVVRRGRLLPIPDGFTLMSPAKAWPIVKSPIFSPLGKLRIAAEVFSRPRQTDADESLRSFVVRHFGREAFDRLIQPLIGGIYTADPAKLSMHATLPQFVELERKFGSLIRGMRNSNPTRQRGAPSDHHASGARYGLFVAPKGGMSSLIDALAARLPAGTVRLNSRVEQIKRAADARWRITIASQSPESFDALVLAVSAPLAASLLRDVHYELAALIAQIPYAGCSVAVTAYRRDQIAFPCNGSGFVVPTVENRRIIAGSFASQKFAGRAPEDRILMRVFVGGALQPELTDLPDDDIRRIVREELGELLGVRSEPEYCDVIRWQGMMPQYHVGHLDLVAKIEERAAAIPGFALAGNAYRGVGIPFCVRSGEQAAERLISSRHTPCAVFEDGTRSVPAT